LDDVPGSHVFFHATTFGIVVDGLQVVALEFAPNGTLYAVGDTNPASSTFNSLYTVDEKSGTFTRVGSTGVPPPEFFMDFAFDSRGTMYGATGHGLFTIDPKTGTATKVVDFVGGGDISSLSYNAKQDKLYATDFKIPNSALYLIDTQTGFLKPGRLHRISVVSWSCAVDPVRKGQSLGGALHGFAVASTVRAAATARRYAAERTST
jgi:hypothetical protein